MVRHQAVYGGYDCILRSRFPACQGVVENANQAAVLMVDSVSKRAIALDVFEDEH